MRTIAALSLVAALSIFESVRGADAPLDPEKAITELQALKGKIKLEGKLAVGANLADIDIQDSGLVFLEALPQLKTLTLRHGYKVTPAGLDHLKGLKQLETLDVWDLKKGVNDKSLATLVAMLPQLKNLDIGGCPVTDAGLTCLAELKGLESLVLTYTNVTDAGIEQIVKLKTLKKLAVNITKITPAGVEKLKAALPQCKIN